jgi:hypothetical protein
MSSLNVFVPVNKIKTVQEVGFEPTRIAPSDLESDPLTTPASLLSQFDQSHSHIIPNILHILTIIVGYSTFNDVCFATVTFSFKITLIMPGYYA